MNLNENIGVVKKLIKDRNYTAAILNAETLLASLDQNATQPTDKMDLLQALGTALYFEGKVGRSIECFKQVLTINPKNTDAAISLSVMYNDIGKYDEARNIYQIANQSLQLKKPGTDFLLDRKFSIKHFENAELYFKFHRYDEALEDYSKAALLDPQNLLIRIKIAKCYAKKGFTTRAIQELLQVTHENPDFIESRVQLGLMYFSQGNVIDAQIEWERVLRDAPENKEVLGYLEMAKRSKETTS